MNARSLLRATNRVVAQAAPQTIAEHYGLLLDFYVQQRAKGCALEEDGDMLLLQWGVYDSGMGEHFEFDLTRQLTWSTFNALDRVRGHHPDDCREMWQLSATVRIRPTPELRQLERLSRWIHRPEGVAELGEFMLNSAAYRAVASESSSTVVVSYSRV